MPSTSTSPVLWFPFSGGRMMLSKAGLLVVLARISPLPSFFPFFFPFISSVINQNPQFPQSIPLEIFLPPEETKPWHHLPPAQRNLGEIFFTPLFL